MDVQALELKLDRKMPAVLLQWTFRKSPPWRRCWNSTQGEGHHRPQKDWLLWRQLLIPDVLNPGIIPQPETGKEI